MEDIVRVTRVIVYEGPRSIVESNVTHSIQGTRVMGSKGNINERLTITAVTLDTFPVIITPAASAKAAYDEGFEAVLKAVTEAEAEADE